MKNFKDFKIIAYKNAIPHTIYKNGKKVNIPKGKAVPVRSRSSAGGGSGSDSSNGGSGGNGDE